MSRRWAPWATEDRSDPLTEESPSQRSRRFTVVPGEGGSRWGAGPCVIYVVLHGWVRALFTSYYMGPHPLSILATLELSGVLPLSLPPGLKSGKSLLLLESDPDCLSLFFPSFSVSLFLSPLSFSSSLPLSSISFLEGSFLVLLTLDLRFDSSLVKQPLLPLSRFPCPQHFRDAVLPSELLSDHSDHVP